FWLRVEQVNVARPAVHEERDHGAGARTKLWDLGLEVKGLRSTRHVRRCGEEVFLPQQPRESDASDAHRVAREKVAAGPELDGACTRVRCHFHTAWGEASRTGRQMKLKTGNRE